MTCNEFRAYADADPFTLSLQQRKAVYDHLKSCMTCEEWAFTLPTTTDDSLADEQEKRLAMNDLERFEKMDKGDDQ